jgi:hypothetical protein
MASNKAHHATGWAAGIMAASLVAKAGAGGPYHLWSALSFAMGLAGGTAPDWLEVAWWSRSRRLWITHRTWTHWGLAWIALLAASYHWLGGHPLAAALFGFAAGGLVHLLADWPNPLGVPWVAGRHSLKLWNSGHCDWLIVAAAWIGAAAVADQVWFHGAYRVWLIHHARAL